MIAWFLLIWSLAINIAQAIALKDSADRLNATMVLLDSYSKLADSMSERLIAMFETIIELRGRLSEYENSENR